MRYAGSFLVIIVAEAVAVARINTYNGDAIRIIKAERPKTEEFNTFDCIFTLT